jgi:hypothetical protein
MNVAVICEFSGVVRDAFIKEGHKAISFDLLPTESPGPHHEGNIWELKEKYVETEDIISAMQEDISFIRIKQADMEWELRIELAFIEGGYGYTTHWENESATIKE